MSIFSTRAPVAVEDDSEELEELPVDEERDDDVEEESPSPTAMAPAGFRGEPLPASPLAYCQRPPQRLGR
jgi:hypothetical protein